MWPALFIPLPLYFRHLFLPKLPKLSPFSCLGFHTKTSHKESYATLKCSSSISHHVFHAQAATPVSLKCDLESCSQWLVVMGFMSGHWGWGSSGAALKGAQTRCSFLGGSYFGFPTAILPLCSSGLVMVTDGLMTPVMGMGVEGTWYCWAFLSFRTASLCSFASVQMSFYHITTSCYTMSIPIKVFLLSHFDG